MAELSFSLADIFEQTFGYKTQAFDPEFSDLPTRLQVSKTGAPYYDNDGYGNEYFLPVSIAVPSSVSLIRCRKQTANTISFQLPFPVVSVSVKKHIIQTPLTERRGTVKEVINSTDYEITIKGMIIAQTNDFPEDYVTDLRTLFEINEAVQMQCALTDIFLLRPDRKGSDNVVIKELSFPPVTGIKGVRPYEMKFVSDESFNLEEIK